MAKKLSDYEKHLKAADKVGASKAQGLDQLAQHCSILPWYVGPGISPEMVFNGAVKKGIGARELMKLPKTEIENLMWEE